MKHIPVLFDECINALNLKENGIYVDCTFGGGGHSTGILKKLDKGSNLYGIDRDDRPKFIAQELKKKFKNFEFIEGKFSDIKKLLKNQGVNKVDGILVDLGVSSFQLDEGERGFSYNKDFKLDMRMDKRDEISAYEVVNRYTKEELMNIFYKYGDEKYAGRIADKIILRREKEPILSTFQLVEIVKSALPNKELRKKGHPCKRVFQAIRIEVNNEMYELEELLVNGSEILNKNGRFALISFHSLEDRVIKEFFKKKMNPCTCPKEFPICICNKVAEYKKIFKKPITPNEEELIVNLRSKSAKLRIYERIV